MTSKNSGKMFSDLYHNIIRWWLTGILLFLPFQFTITNRISSWSNGLASIINKLDEVTIIIFFLLAIRELYKNKEILNPLYFILIFPLFLMCLGGLLSGTINSNSLLITFLGTFDYIKNFLVIIIYAAFFRSINELKAVFRLLLIVAVFIGIVAIVEEAWMLLNRYIIEIDLAENGTDFLSSILPNMDNAKLSGNRWRLGMYRVSSIMSHYNLLGLYSLLILTIYLNISRRLNAAVTISMVAGVFFSVSRTLYAGFALLVGVQIFKSNKNKMIFVTTLILMIILLFNLSSLKDFNVRELLKWQEISEGNSEQPREIAFRKFAKQKAILIWKDHPLWGVGPGMFGGAIATKYNSPVYEEYSASFIVRWFKSLDQFWPQLMAEMGLWGVMAFSSLLFTLIAIFCILQHNSASDELKGLFRGLTIFIFALFIYTFGGSLNIVAIVFTFCALAGMGIGCSASERLRNDNKYISGTACK